MCPVKGTVLLVEGGAREESEEEVGATELAALFCLKRDTFLAVGGGGRELALPSPSSLPRFGTAVELPLLMFMWSCAVVQIVLLRRVLC